MWPEHCRAARARRGAAAAACLLAAASTLAGCSRGLRTAPAPAPAPAPPPAPPSAAPEEDLASGSILTYSYGWRLWNETTGEAVRNFSWYGDTAVFSPTGERLLTAGNLPMGATATAWMLSASTGEVLQVFDGNASSNDFASAAFSPTGEYVLLAACCESVWPTPEQSTSMMTFDVSTGEVLLYFSVKDSAHRVVKSAVWSPTGDYLLTAFGDGIAPSGDGIAMLWNASNGEAVREFAGHSRGVNTAVFSPAGERVLTASYDSTAKMWNASTGEVLRNFTGHTGGVSSAVFSPTGDRVLTASTDGSAIMWNASTGEVLQRFTGHRGAVTSAVFSPTGDYVLTTAWDSPAKLWNALSGEVLNAFVGSGEGGVHSAAFLPKMWAASSRED